MFSNSHFCLRVRSSSSYNVFSGYASFLSLPNHYCNSFSVSVLLKNIDGWALIGGMIRMKNLRYTSKRDFLLVAIRVKVVRVNLRLVVSNKLGLQ